MRWILILTVFLTVTTSTLEASTIYVPDDYPTIQQAIYASKDCDTVLVRAGLYAENVDFLGKAITLTSEEGPDDTTIQPLSGPTVQCVSGEGADTVLDGFRLMTGGDGMVNTQSSPTVTNCHFFTGDAGMRNTQSHPIVTNSQFVGCFDSGMVNNGSSPTITESVFSGNFGYEFAGGMINTNDSNPVIINTVFWGNYEGPSFTGGAIYNKESSPTMINCTIAVNGSLATGAGMYSTMNSHPTVANSIFWNCGWNEIYNGYNSTTTVTYSDVWGGYPGTGNIDADPQFVPTVNWEMDVHLTHPSPCKDAGNNAAVVGATDFEGDPRIVNTTVDMGADEFHRHLYYTGWASPGQSVDLKFIDLPGSSPVGFWISFGVLEPPIQCRYGDWYLAFPLYGPWLLPPVPSNGVEVISGTIPSTPPGPYDIYFQAIMGTPLKLTNLCKMHVK